jgi:hypothetical protein
MDEIDVNNVDDLVLWLRAKLNWFATDQNVLDSAYHSSAYRHVFDEAQAYAAGLGPLGSLDILGVAPPTSLIGDSQVHARIGAEVQRKLELLLDHLTDGKPRGKKARASISAQYRTRAMSKQKAAELIRGGNSDSGVEWLNKCISDGTISCETLSRQSHVFDWREFPASVKSKILP